MYADITGRKRAIDHYLKEVQSHTEDTEDADILDRVLSLLTQASAALTSVSHRATKEEEGLGSFELKEKFAPMQKNETQLRLWKTAKDPGRKRQCNPMKYM